jgi:glycosyltransferase involved in cell wall biosynthesis
MNGIRFVREGTQWTVHWRAFVRYRKSLSERFDLVIDEVNTVPFLTPVWARVPSILVIFQLARDVWWYESPFPLNLLGYLLEPLYLAAYRTTHAVTISQSTEQDLRRLGFRRPITIMPIGIDSPTDVYDSKPKEKVFLYVGRLSRSKRVEDLVRALAIYRSAGGAGVLWIVGTGSVQYVESLNRLGVQLGISDSVVYFGHASADQKHRYMHAAYALLMASVREGWGLVVTECNRCGTPAIVYDVPGLRDSVRHMRTGLVVAPTPKALSEAMLLLTGSPDLYQTLRAEGRRWSEGFTYEAGIQVLSQAMVREVVH